MTVFRPVAVFALQQQVLQGPLNTLSTLSGILDRIREINLVLVAITHDEDEAEQ
jgi:hypothetical protein